MSASRRREYGAEQRRMAILALAAAVLLLAGATLGAVEAFTYLAPALTLFVLFALGRYPGERAYLRRLRRSNRPQRPRAARSPRRPHAALPRGGALLANGLAGRAPPLLAG
ncbi:MAG TPA: hypothetical protein VGF25_03670 [Thermoleophilaceae bacterium]